MGTRPSNPSWPLALLKRRFELCSPVFADGQLNLGQRRIAIRGPNATPHKRACLVLVLCSKACSDAYFSIQLARSLGGRAVFGLSSSQSTQFGAGTSAARNAKKHCKWCGSKLNYDAKELQEVQGKPGVTQASID